MGGFLSKLDKISRKHSTVQPLLISLQKSKKVLLQILLDSNNSEVELWQYFTLLLTTNLQEMPNIGEDSSPSRRAPIFFLESKASAINYRTSLRFTKKRGVSLPIETWGKKNISNSNQHDPILSFFVTETLKASFKRKLRNPNHILHRMVQKFYDEFVLIFNTQHHNTIIFDKCFAKVCGIVKCFVAVMTKYYIHFYGANLAHYDTLFLNEGVDASSILTTQIYDFILEFNNFYILSFLETVLKHTLSAKLQHLATIFYNKRDQPISEYMIEENNDNFFLPKLSKKEQPYQFLIDKLLPTPFFQTPHSKFKKFSSLDTELLQNTLQFFGPSNPDIISNFAMDDKVTIFIYCIIQSNNPNLLVDLTLIQNFIPENDLLFNQDNMTLIACLDFILHKL